MRKQYARHDRKLNQYQGAAISEGMRRAIAEGKQIGRKRVHNHQDIIDAWTGGIRSQARIARSMGCSASVVHQVLKKAGLLPP